MLWPAMGKDKVPGLRGDVQLGEERRGEDHSVVGETGTGANMVTKALADWVSWNAAAKLFPVCAVQMPSCPNFTILWDPRNLRGHWREHVLSTGL